MGEVGVHLVLDEPTEQTSAGQRDRETWRRRQLLDGCSGALDYPGTSWRDRAAIKRGNDVFLCGDSVTAPGLLSAVS